MSVQPADLQSLHDCNSSRVACHEHNNASLGAATIVQVLPHDDMTRRASDLHGLVGLAGPGADKRRAVAAPQGELPVQKSARAGHALQACELLQTRLGVGPRDYKVGGELRRAAGAAAAAPHFDSCAHSTDAPSLLLAVAPPLTKQSAAAALMPALPAELLALQDYPDSESDSDAVASDAAPPGAAATVGMSESSAQHA